MSTTYRELIRRTLFAIKDGESRVRGEATLGNSNGESRFYTQALGTSAASCAIYKPSGRDC